MHFNRTKTYHDVYLLAILLLFYVLLLIFRFHVPVSAHVLAPSSLLWLLINLLFLVTSCSRCPMCGHLITKLSPLHLLPEEKEATRRQLLDQIEQLKKKVNEL